MNIYHKIITCLVALTYFSSIDALSAENISVLVDEGIYYQESRGEYAVALERFEAAIQSEAKNDQVLFNAYVRAIECCLELEKVDRAKFLFEQLNRSFSSTDYLAEKRSNLAQLLNDSIARFDYLDPEPWSDYEQHQYQLKSGGGAASGSAYLFYETTEADGETYLFVEGRYAITQLLQGVFTSVTIKPETFLPLESTVRMMSFPTVSAFYGFEDNDRTLLHGKGETASGNRIPPDSIDSEQWMAYVRRLPQREGFKLSLPITSVLYPEMQGAITVLASEQVTVPAGTFECVPVRFEVSANGTIISKQVSWVELGGKRRVIKHDAGAWSIELQASLYEQRDAAQILELEDPGIELRLPEDWYYGDQIASGQNHTVYRSLLGPKLAVDALLVAVDRKHASPEVVFQGDYKILQNFFKEYTFRDGTKEITEINGLPAVRFVADYQQNGQAMVEYRCYYLGEQTYWFVFRMKPDAFEANKADLDTIIQNFKGS